MRKPEAHPFWSISMIVVPAVLVVCAHVACKRSLYTLCVQSGWLAAALTAAVALTWWRFDADAPLLRRRVRLQLHLSCLLVVMFTVHVDMRVPNGWMGIALAALFIAMVVSTIVGTMIVHTGARAGDPLAQAANTRQSGLADLVPVRRWLFVNASLSYSLLGLALIHGAFVHSHGLLAFFFLER